MHKIREALLEQYLQDNPTFHTVLPPRLFTTACAEILPGPARYLKDTCMSLGVHSVSAVDVSTTHIFPSRYSQ